MGHNKEAESKNSVKIVENRKSSKEKKKVPTKNLSAKISIFSSR